MANYFTKLSTMVVLPEADIEWATALHEAVTSLVDEDPVDMEALSSPHWDMPAADMLAIAERIAGDIDDAELEVSKHRSIPPALWIQDNYGQANLDYAVLLLQEVLERIGSEEAVAFQYAHTSDRPRVDAYGGGVVVVTKDQVFREDTAETLKRALDEMVPPVAPEQPEP